MTLEDRIVERTVTVGDEWVSEGDGFRNIMTDEFMLEDDFFDMWNK